ncbi:hypothetical protein [Flintibacter sp.]|uniref:hypothetical protein n=1 Tax=Flintibacter sp. TaxID=1918624 RepID=UPI003D0B654A
MELLGGFELLKAVFQRGFPLRLALCFNASVVLHGILSPSSGIALREKAREIFRPFPGL